MVKIFTSKNLDGIGCAVLSKMVYEEGIDITYCDYTDINEMVQNHIDSKEFEKYSVCYITDIGVNEETEKLINHINSSLRFIFKKHFVLIDCNKRKPIERFWCSENDENEDYCSSEIFYKYLLKNDCLNELFINEENNKTQNLLKFIKLIEQYNKFQFNNANIYIKNMLYIYGINKCVEKIIEEIRDKGIDNISDRNSEEILPLKLEKIRTGRYIKEKENKMVKLKIKGHKVGIIFAEQYVDELGYVLCKNNIDLDYVTIFSGDKTYYKTIKSGIDVGDIAKLYAGDGSPQSAVAKVSDYLYDIYINAAFKKKIFYATSKYTNY